MKMEGRSATIDFSNHREFTSNERIEATEDELIAFNRYMKDEYIPTANAKRLIKMGPKDRVKASYIFRVFAVEGRDEVLELAKLVEDCVGSEVENYVGELGIRLTTNDLALVKCVWFTEDSIYKRHRALRVLPRGDEDLNVSYEVRDGAIYWPDSTALHIRRQMVLERVLLRLKKRTEACEEILHEGGLGWILRGPTPLVLMEGTSQFNCKTIVSLTWFGRGPIKVPSKTFGTRLMASLTSQEIDLLTSIVALSITVTSSPTLTLLNELLAYK